MMGLTHAATGTLGFGGATLLYRFGLQEIAIGTVITTGAALINDLDHHKATATRSFGPLSWVVSKLVIFVFGPHRHGTHSILFAVVLGLGTQMAVIYRHSLGGMIPLCVIMSLSVASVVRLAKIPGWLDDVGAVAAVVAMIVFTDVDLTIVPACMMAGALIHILGDCLTDRGCPVLWPMTKKRFTLGIFTTGKIGEKIVRVIIVIGLVAVIVAHIVTGA